MEKKALKFALFGAFLVCLYVSIPHLAWVFYSWENTTGAGTPLSLSIFGMDILTTKQEWLNAYLQAMSIDVIIAFLSYTLTNSKSLGFKGLGYTFVGLLILLSWFFNWLYAKAHAPMMADNSIWGQTFLWGLISIKRITPIINSSLPVFAFAFTVMIDRLTGEQMTAAEIEQLATESEKINTALGKLRTAKNERTAQRIGSIFGLAKQVKDQGKELLSSKNSEGETEENLERNTDEMDAVFAEETEENLIGKLEENEKNPERKAKESERETPFEMPGENAPLWLAKGGSTIHLDDVVNHTNLTRKTLNNLVKTGKIVRTKNANIVRKDSLIAWAKQQRIALEKSNIIELSAKRNAEETDTESLGEMEEIPEGKLEKTLRAMQENPKISDEELAEILQLKRAASARFWRLKVKEMQRQNAM